MPYSSDPVSDAQRHWDDLEEQAVGACYETARRNGHTKEEAEMCDEGSVGCLDCPFKGRD